MSAEVITLPGLVDMHVHLREPGAVEKEDLVTGTRAALAGGIVAVMDMPNNPGQPTNSEARLRDKRALAEHRVYCDIGFYYGSQPADDNIGSFPHVAKSAMGLKSYLEVTTGNTSGKEPKDFKDIWTEWHEVASPTQPIILHSEERTIDEALRLAAGEIGHPTHVAHVSNRAELEAIQHAKSNGWPVTAGVTPHHLFLTEDNVENWYQRMKPPLATEADRAFLWENMADIDVVETDHAPHTIEEKENANRSNPGGSEAGVTSYGVPGVEFMLPLLLKAVRLEKLTQAQLIDKTSTRPREILGLQHTRGTNVRVAMVNYEVGPNHIWSKCGWSPYLGRVVTGRIVEVTLRGWPVYNGHDFLGRRGEGRVLNPRR